MRRAVKRSLPLFLLASFVVTALAATPVGRWKLVEQRYAGGEANLVDANRPVRLELRAEGTGVTGRIWAGDDEASALDWPAHETGAGPVPIEVTGRTVDVTSGLVEVRYRVPPAPGDDLVLDVVERYQAADDGRTLTGTVRVTFTGGETNRGGYVLQRRWERER